MPHQHTWTETSTLLKKTKGITWKTISDQLTVPIETIKKWAMDDSVPAYYYEKLQKELSNEKNS